NIRGVMRQCAQRKGILIDVRGFAQKCFYKIAAANIVNKITEQLVAERVISHVLNEASAIGICMGLAQVFIRCCGKFLQQHGLDGVGPQQVDNFFVRQYRVSVAYLRETADNQQRCQCYANKGLHGSSFGELRKLSGCLYLDALRQSRSAVQSGNSQKKHAAIVWKAMVACLISVESNFELLFLVGSFFNIGLVCDLVYRLNK